MTRREARAIADFIEAVMWAAAPRSAGEDALDALNHELGAQGSPYAFEYSNKTGEVVPVEDF